MKRIFALLLAAIMLMSLASCAEDDPLPVLPTEPDDTKGTVSDRGGLMILFTGGLEGAYAQDETKGAFGYAALRAYVKSLEQAGETVILVDGGDSVDPQESKKLWQIVDACAYDIRVPGTMELSAGVDAMKNRGKELHNCTYISCNLIDLARNTTVFDPYVIMELEDSKIGFVGVTRPESLDDEGYEILGRNDGQLLRETVQQAIDDAADAGADFVIVVGNLGTAPEDSPCTTAEVIAGITGLAAWLDCGSGAVLDGDTVADKDDFPIPICAPGAGYACVGQLRLDLNDGSAAVTLLTDPEEEDRAVLNLVKELEDTE